MNIKKINKSSDATLNIPMPDFRGPLQGPPTIPAINIRMFHRKLFKGVGYPNNTSVNCQRGAFFPPEYFIGVLNRAFEK